MAVANRRRRVCQLVSTDRLVYMVSTLNLLNLELHMSIIKMRERQERRRNANAAAYSSANATWWTFAARALVAVGLIGMGVRGVLIDHQSASMGGFMTGGIAAILAFNQFRALTMTGTAVKVKPSRRKPAKRKR